MKLIENTFFVTSICISWQLNWRRSVQHWLKWQRAFESKAYYDLESFQAGENLRPGICN